MAKNAASEAALGKLHDKIAQVFTKVLERYERRMEVIDTIDVEDELLKELFDEGAMPSPAMLSAVTKFLKDNEISFSTEQVDNLTAQQRRLEENRQKRGNIVDLTTLHAIGE